LLYPPTIHVLYDVIKFWYRYMHNFRYVFLTVQYSVSQKIPLPELFSDIFPKRLGIFSPRLTHLLYVHIYARVQIFIQLSPTLTKLCHIQRDHHYMLKMSAIC